MNNEENGCPRCSDYDQLKDELEHNKKNADREVKDSLKQCQTEKKKIQKQLLTVGACAVIGGTILGKEFVDKIAEYIESFNSVKNAATDIIGQATPSTPPQGQSDTTEEKEEKDEKEEKKPNSKPVTRPTMYAGSGYSPYTSKTSIPRIGIFPEEKQNDFIMDPYTEVMLNSIPPVIEDDLLAFSASMPPIETTPFQYPPFDIPSYGGYAGSEGYNIPGPGVLGVLGVSLPFINRRRRK
jgi:hypothetical protein